MFDINFSSPEEICLALCQRLRAQRLAQSLSQVALANLAGVSTGTVRNLETKGQASLDSLVHIIIALGLTDDLSTLFVLKLNSIARMEKAERAKRQRAPRRRTA
ncbi:MAG: helix-turn-helix domain-containing protein [Thiobacillaceae bacterium]